MTQEQIPPFKVSDNLNNPAIRHGFFGRKGGVSKGLYQSLNGGLGSEDDRESVLENRARIARAVEIAPQNLVTVYQIHSAKAVTVTEPWAPEQAPQADAMVTAVPGIGLAILAADCGPILFADPLARIIGAAHAGWRGAFEGVLESTVEAMVALGARPENIRAAIGPSISSRSYEVGPEFQARFTEQAASNVRYFADSERLGHFYFDLPRYTADRLAALGLTSVAAPHACTYEDADGYFSYRRTTHLGEPDYGRNLSVITLRQSTCPP